MKKEAGEKISFAEYWRLRITHRILHRNRLFYTLTPELSIAMIRAFQEADPYLMADGAYYEFGVFKGYNLWFVNKLKPSIPIYGFDSFHGMPRTRGAHPHHSMGMYSASEEEVRYHLNKHKADMGRIQLFKGWFCDEYFDYSLSSVDFLPAAVVTIDCDLYVSAVPVLRFLVPYLRPNTILIFDDWHMGPPSEADAWHEAKEMHRIIDETLFDYGLYGHAVRIKEIANGQTQ